MTATALLDTHVRPWVAAACAANGWPEPAADYYARVAARIPVDLLEMIGSGIKDGLVRCDGYSFTLPAQGPHKGPYKWMSNRQWAGGPHPNWEYLVQIAEYVRLSRVAESHGLRLIFEDHSMDLALLRRRRSGRLRRGQGARATASTSDRGSDEAGGGSRPECARSRCRWTSQGEVHLARAPAIFLRGRAWLPPGIPRGMAIGHRLSLGSRHDSVPRVKVKARKGTILNKDFVKCFEWIARRSTA